MPNQLEIPPRKCWVNICGSPASPESWVRASQQRFANCGKGFLLVFKKLNQVWSTSTPLVDGTIAILVRKGSQSTRISIPEIQLVDHHLLPRRVANEYIEASVRPKEDLGEKHWHMGWLERGEFLLRCTDSSRLGDGVDIH